MTAERFTTLSTQAGHVCALTAAGAAFCWGDNGQRQIGPAMDVALVPVRSQPTMTFTAIDASLAVTCATPATGPSLCWGLNNMGKLGIGSRLEITETPLAIAGDPRFVKLAGGNYHMCGLTADGALWCWGGNREGELGTG
jgi:alpha-tubulin suppressor-like RCC1 family protein